MWSMIQWNIDPEIFRFGFFAIRWYGLCFALAFILGFQIMERIFQKEKVREELVESLFIYSVVGTLVGARVGHCLFYEPEVYLTDPIRILKIWEGGLASHGAAVGVFTALALFCRRFHISFLWLVDRQCIAAALAGGLIRLGNLFNSEIVGKPAQIAWSFVFSRVDQLPRHPTQLYESLTYFSTAAVLAWLYRKGNKGEKRGFLFGIFLIVVFGSRFLWELLKENQVSFESSLPINMGQILSIPLLLTGAGLIYRSRKPKPAKALA
jgi:prolipoprotein diacylglyceryl transferase